MQRVTPVVGIFLEVYVVNGTEKMSSFNYVRRQENSSRFTEPQEPQFYASIAMLPCLLMTEMIS